MIKKKNGKQHEEVGEDMPLHREIKDQGMEIFKFEVIKLCSDQGSEFRNATFLKLLHKHNLKINLLQKVLIKLC